MDTQSKLSLAAQFDDMCRFSNSLMTYSGLEDEVMRLLHSQEQLRLKWMAGSAELNKYHNQIRELESNTRVLETKLKNVRYALAKEASERERLQKERDTYYRKLVQLRKFLTEDEEQQQGMHNGLRPTQRDRFMSALSDLPIMETLHEESTDGSISDLEFDKTEDSLCQSRHSQSRRKSGNRSGRKSNSRREELSPSKSRNDSKRSRIVEQDMEVEMAEEAGAIMNGHRSVPAPKALPKCETVSNIKSSSVVTNSTPELRKRTDMTPAASPMDRKQECRSHSFVPKKVFRPGEKCGPCGGAIRFCNTCYRCSDCMVTCHPDCKDKVPIPCIPFVSKTRNGRCTLISDFVSSESPKIPALIFHCCTEIEKRGLNETGLYRIPGSDKEVKELKEKILKSKNGMPSLASYDIHVICSVVKDFLRSVDEPLVSRTLWRDFVRASELPDPIDRKTSLYQAVMELPDANRDTLAFMIRHLQKVSDEAVVKMPKSSLAKVFGPAIVGHSMSSPPPVEMMAEVKKQIGVMHLLLDTHSDYWNSFLSNGVDTPNGPSATTAESTAASRRLSAGRTIGGSVRANGLLTPHKSFYQQTLQRPLVLKPLF